MNLVLYCAGWRSILVSAAVFEEGPKNPYKGTTMNPVVSASYAQFGVDAGGRRLSPADRRAAPNGMGIHDPASAETGYCAEAYSRCGSSDFCTIPDRNLHCGATRLLRRERCVQRSLPCVNRQGKRSQAAVLMALSPCRYSLESLFAKEDRKRTALLWKSPRLS